MLSDRMSTLTPGTIPWYNVCTGSERVFGGVAVLTDRSYLSRGAKWSGKVPIPAVDEVIDIKMNWLGKGRVIGYDERNDNSGNLWIGVYVLLNSPPAWYVRKNGEDVPVFVYGAELNRLGRGI